MFTPPGENIIETKTCAISGEQFVVTEKDMQMYDLMSPVFDGQKFQIPSPTLSPRERMIRRDIWRNESSLHHRTCAATGDVVISMYHEESGISVYKNEYWWSDAWSAYDYGREFDFNRPFFDQIHELNLAVPAFATSSTYSTIENSPYINRATGLKNCHLTFNANESEDMYYCSAVTKSYSCADCFNIVACEHCYELVSCRRCTSSQFLTNCQDCSDCAYGRDLRNCQNCFGCVNLTGKSYCFNNEQLSQQEYENKL